MTLQDWYKDDGNRARLANLLADPVLVKALAVIEESNCPVFRAGVAASDLALIHSFQSGVHHVRRTLQFLTKPKAADAALPEPWTGPHIKPE